MTRKNYKKTSNKNRNVKKNKQTVKNLFRKRNLTKNVKYGGEMSELYKAKHSFRTEFITLINKLNKSTSRNITKDTRNNLIELFSKKKQFINTLIPITSNYKAVLYNVATNSYPKNVYDYVSPIIIILNELSNILTIKDLELILNAYFDNGGNFNSLSSRFKLSPFKNELNKKNIQNIRLLLDKSNPFHIIEDGLDEETKIQLTELIPNEQKIETRNVIEDSHPQEVSQYKEVITYPKLQLPFELPVNNENGYDKNIVPEFWKPIFGNGEELLQIRDIFTRLYERDKYISNVQRPIEICNILERIIPSYLTPSALDFGQTPKTFVNINILNCFITLLLGILLSKLHETNQDYLFIFKGGRALQLSLVGIYDIGKYFSEDTDILIVPNRIEKASYDLVKMENLSAHIGYLIKWFIPQDINIIISLPTNPKNLNKDITKVLYNDNRVFKALSDIGFGEIPEDIKKYFDEVMFSYFYVSELNLKLLFIIPTLDDMLSEKLYFYSKYFIYKEKLQKNEIINKKGYSNLTTQECDFYLYKFKRAIFKLVEAIMKRDYSEAEDLHNKETPILILRGIISNFEDYSNEEKNQVINDIYKYKF
jgi:hypothetical protein